MGAGISLAPNGLRVLASLPATRGSSSPSLADRVVQEVGEAVPVTHVMRPDGSTITRFDTMGQQVTLRTATVGVAFGPYPAESPTPTPPCLTQC